MDALLERATDLLNSIPTAIRFAVGGYFAWTFARFLYHKAFLSKSYNIEGKQFLITGAAVFDDELHEGSRAIGEGVVSNRPGRRPTEEF